MRDCLLFAVTVRWRLLLLLAATACVLSAGTRLAIAQEEPEALIRQGVEMRKRGDDLKAHGYFQRAYDIARTPRSAAQLGLADLAIEDNVAAEQHLSEAMSSSDPWVRQNRGMFEKSRATARSRLAKLVISGAPESTTVEIAGHPPVALSPDATVWIPPGGAELRFAAPKYEPETKTVNVAAGASGTLEIALRSSSAGKVVAAVPDTRPIDLPPPKHDELPPPSPPSPNEPSTRPWQVTGAWVAGGVGLAFVVTGVTAQLLYASKINEFNSVTDAPNPSGHCDKALPNDGGGSCKSLLDAANTRSTVATIGYVAGGVAIAGAVVLYLIAPSASARHDVAASCAPARQASGVSCALSLTF
jgi:hypothetical protein